MTPALWRLIGSFALGALVAGGCVALGWGEFAPLGGWIAMACSYTAAVWLTIGPFDAAQTRGHAVEEDPPRRWAHLLMIVVSLASLAAVGALLAGAAAGQTGATEALVGAAGVASSWLVVHTLYAVRYAHLYYLSPAGGIDLSDDPAQGGGDPTYIDFAYLAFTLGMTFQVSDTTITSPTIRRAALGHSLLSYLLGVVALAMAINVVASLAGSAGH